MTEGPPIERTSLRPCLVVSCPSAGILKVCEVKNVPLLAQNEEHVHKMRSFNQGPLPPSVYLVDTDVIHVINGTRPFLHTASDQKLDGGKA